MAILMKLLLVVQVSVYVNGFVFIVNDFVNKMYVMSRKFEET